MSTFTDWLKSDNKSPVLLVELKAYSEGEEVTRYLSSSAFNTGASDTPANTIYRQRIIGNPYFERSLTNAFYGRSFIGTGALELNNIDGGLDSWLNDAFDGRDIVYKLGDFSWSISQFETVFTGITQGIQVQSDSVLQLTVKGLEEVLNKPFQENLIDSGDQIENPIPRTIGYAKNVEAVLIDEGAREYQVEDGISEDVCVQLYDKGKPSGITVTKDNSAGTFTLGSAPSGRVTADVKGAKPSGTFYETPGEVLTHIVGSDLTVDSVSMAALDSAAPYELGINYNRRVNKMDVIDSVIPGGWWWGVSRTGTFEGYLLSEPSASVLTITENDTYGDLRPQLLELPTWRVSVGYEKNHSVETNPDDTATDARKEFLKSEYRVVTAEDASVKTTHLEAIDAAQYNSFIVGESDAQTEATRLLALFKVQRIQYQVDCFAVPFQLNMGDTVTLKDGRFGLSAGVDCVVVGMTEYFLDNKVSLTLWR